MLNSKLASTRNLIDGSVRAFLVSSIRLFGSAKGHKKLDVAKLASGKQQTRKLNLTSQLYLTSHEEVEQLGLGSNRSAVGVFKSLFCRFST